MLAPSALANEVEDVLAGWRRLFDAGKAVGGKTLTEVLVAYAKQSGP